MQTKHVLIISAVALFVMGIGLLLFPVEAMTLIDLNINSTFMAQLFGVALIGFGSLNWISRNKDELSLRPIITANLIFYILGFLVTLIHYLGGAGSDMLWLFSGLFLLMTAAFGFAYCCLEVWEHLTGKLQ